MCWGTPARVLRVDRENSIAVVDFGDGIPREAIIGVSPEELNEGDLVVVHAGVVISKIDVGEIEETVKMLESVEALPEELEGLLTRFRNIAEKTRSRG